MIAISGLHKRFGRNAVLCGIELNVKPGGITAVLGPNGSGKTTLIKSILGMVVPTSGTITISGRRTEKDWRYRELINYLPQIANFPANLRFSELLRMVGDIRQEPREAERLLDLFELRPFLDKKLGTLSGGTRQKVNIVLTFMFNSPLLMLDEPTTGLDPHSLIQLKRLIEEERNKGKTILITSHIMSFVEEVAEDIIYLLEGKIHFKGSITELKKKTSQKNLEHAITALTVKPPNNDV